MGSIFDAMYMYLVQMDEAYANRWMAFITSTRNTWEDDKSRACRFWALELTAAPVDTRYIREHLVPENNHTVIMELFTQEILPLIAQYPKAFTQLSLEWGSIY